MWTTWTAWTRTIGASDLKMNLLAGNEATHYTNVPCVVEVSRDYFPITFELTHKKVTCGRQNVTTDM